MNSEPSIQTRNTCAACGCAITTARADNALCLDCRYQPDETASHAPSEHDVALETDGTVDDPSTLLAAKEDEHCPTCGVKHGIALDLERLEQERIAMAVAVDFIIGDCKNKQSVAAAATRATAVAVWCGRSSQADAARKIRASESAISASISKFEAFLKSRPTPEAYDSNETQ